MLTPVVVAIAATTVTPRLAAMLTAAASLILCAHWQAASRLVQQACFSCYKQAWGSTKAANWYILVRLPGAKHLTAGDVSMLLRHAAAVGL